MDRFSTAKSPIKDFLNIKAATNVSPDCLINDKNNRKVLIERKGDVSLLKLKYRIWEKGKGNYGYMIIKLNKIILKKGKKKMVVKKFQGSLEDLENYLTDSIIQVIN